MINEIPVVSGIIVDYVVISNQVLLDELLIVGEK